MAKMFYSLEETAAKLGKSEAEVRQMASNNEITEFRDGDRLIFKVDQIDLLVGDDENNASDMSSMIPLMDTNAGSAIADSPMAPAAPAAPADTGMTSEEVEGSSIGLEDSFSPGASGSSQGLSDFDAAVDLGSGLADSSAGSGSGGGSGIAVFDAEELEAADPAAQTQMTDGGLEGGLNLDQLGSGSGLMDLTRESDDTSLGAEGLLDDIYQGGDDASEETEVGGDLFEGVESAPDLDAGAETAAVAVAAEPYDAKWSGLSGGLALGMIVAGVVGMGVMIMSVMGMVPPMVYDLELAGQSPAIVWMAIPAIVGIVCGLIGFAISKGE